MIKAACKTIKNVAKTWNDKGEVCLEIFKFLPSAIKQTGEMLQVSEELYKDRYDISEGRRICIRVRQARKKMKLTQRQCATKAGLTYSTLIRLENGVSDDKTLKKLAIALHVSTDFLKGCGKYSVWDWIKNK